MGLFKAKKPAERRRYPRISDSLRINYQIANDALHSDCRSSDISEGGIRLNLYQKIEVGTTLKLCIYFQDFAQPSWVIGNVVWIKHTPEKEYPYEAGIEFSFLDSSLRLKIQNHIQSISKSENPPLQH